MTDEEALDQEIARIDKQMKSDTHLYAIIHRIIRAERARSAKLIEALKAASKVWISLDYIECFKGDVSDICDAAIAHYNTDSIVK